MLMQGLRDYLKEDQTLASDVVESEDKYKIKFNITQRNLAG